jgi:hypothetical protein
MRTTLPDTLKFSFFDMVWMKIDEAGEDPGMGQVVGILFKPGASLYQVQWSSDDLQYHYEQELTDEKPVNYSA